MISNGTSLTLVLLLNVLGRALCASIGALYTADFHPRLFVARHS